MSVDNEIRLNVIFPVKIYWKGDEVQLIDYQDDVIATQALEKGKIYEEEDIVEMANQLSEALMDAVRNEANAYSTIESFLLMTFNNRQEYNKQ